MLNSHLVVAFSQDLVVFAERHQKDDGGDVLKAVYPLPPLWPLTSHIHHSAVTVEAMSREQDMSHSDAYSRTFEPLPNMLRCCLSPEDDILHVKGVFNDTRGWHSHSQDVLEVRDIRGLWNPIQVCEIAENGQKRSSIKSNDRISSKQKPEDQRHRREEKILIEEVVCLTLTIWWSRTAGTPCACCSIPVFLHRPTNFWCTWQGPDLTPPPCPPPPQELHRRGTVKTQTIRQLANERSQLASYKVQLIMSWNQTRAWFGLRDSVYHILKHL